MQYWDEKRRAWMPGMRRATLVVVLLTAIAALAAVTQINLATQVQGVLPEANGGTHQSTYTLGDMLYASAANTLSKLAGNTTTTHKFLAQTGTGTNSAAPIWDVLVAGDVPSLDASKITTGVLATARVVNSPVNSRCLHIDASGNVTVAAGDCGTSTINFADAETPTGTINGVNATFTLANSPSPAGSLLLFKNGQLMKAAGADYTLTGNSIAFVSGAIPQTGDVLLAQYRF